MQERLLADEQTPDQDAASQVEQVPLSWHPAQLSGPGHVLAQVPAKERQQIATQTQTRARIRHRQARLALAMTLRLLVQATDLSPVAERTEEAVLLHVKTSQRVMKADCCQQRAKVRQR